MSPVSCPLPNPLDPQAALKKLAEVKQRRSALSPAAQERFAAREMGVDVPTFRAAIKGERALPQPTLGIPKKAKTIEDPRKHAYDAGWNSSKNSRTFDLDGAEARYEAKYGRDARADFAGGWADQAAGYEKYTALQGGQAVEEVPLWLRKFKRITNPSHKDALKYANKGIDVSRPYKTLSIDNAEDYAQLLRRANCGQSAIAYELRRRGYDVFAKAKASGFYPTELQRIMQGGEFITWNQPSVKAITTRLSADPVGARYFVDMTMKGGDGHIFCAEKMADGSIRFIDPQLQSGDVSHYIDLDAASVRIMRVDNAPLSPQIVEELT